MINWKVTKPDAELIGQITIRAAALAEKHHSGAVDKQGINMDVTACHLNGCPLDLKALLETDDGNFGHDVFGIQKHLDRKTGVLLNSFLPRFHAKAESAPISITVNIPAGQQQLADQFTASFEGGSTEWLMKAHYTGINAPEQKPWYADPLLYKEGFAMQVEYDNPEKGPHTIKKPIAWLDVLMGLQLMAEKEPRHFADMMHDQGDAITADVLMQCIVLKEVVYG